ncbi:protein of unknown function, might belong to Site-specific recombinase, phage integrase family protein [Shewanella benthica]|uniref:Uncharacterized protein n=1 Tax=Shewanella benthica TaxID=43661 RepID=A0A330M8K4_9GAMM|nr:protein of unknown function, might belong to Site-specific recombinase, phage integrase family protein [Shewanella benthica]
MITNNTVYKHSQTVRENIMSSSPFLDAIRQDIRLRGYSIRTEKSDLYWIKCYFCFIIKNIRQSLVQGM